MCRLYNNQENARRCWKTDDEMHKRQREARHDRLRFDKAKRRHAIVQSVCDAMLRVVASAFAFESARIRRLSKDHGDSFEMRGNFPGGIASSAPRMETGTTGTGKLCSSIPIPGLNDWSLPSAARCPSGNQTKFFPRFKTTAPNTRLGWR